ncbi:MAG: AAA family ATPase [Saprospiraceae bacterium]|nr:AAA family ATPase [Saprospiraceae bacterium]MDZ4702790.1 AAA family ATPase [Saprospiraceae bacterium]
MKITSIAVHDFRCFERLEVQFSEKHNVHVIIAENMAGKSALMRALRIASNTYISGLVAGSKHGIELSDHRVIGHNPVANISLGSSVETKAIIEDEHGNLLHAHWKKYKDKPSKERTKTLVLNNAANPGLIAKRVYGSVISGKSVLPLFNFIGTEYIHIEASKTSELTLEGNAIQGYKDCFNDKSIKKFLFDWLKRIDGILKEKQYKKIIAFAYGNLPDDAMYVFQQAVKSILPDITEIEWLEDKKQPIIQFKNGDVRLFDMLSDGYRYLILLAGELATRAFILNKHLGRKVLEKTPGIVLIDEFGIHLHPGLQSLSLKRLQETFPKIQFILSTHSPLLINGLKKEQIYLLEVGEEGQRTIRHPDEDAIGLGADGILLEMFGLATTYDDESIASNEEYKILFNKKNNNGLSESEVRRFSELTVLLAPTRLDPTLAITQDDSLTRLVKEKLNERTFSERGLNGLHLPDDVSEQVENILDDIFK